MELSFLMEWGITYTSDKVDIPSQMHTPRPFGLNFYQMLEVLQIRVYFSLEMDQIIRVLV